METKNVLIICITVLIIGAIIAGAAYMIMDKQIKLQEQKLNQTNNTNNTTKVINNTTTVVKEEVTKEPEKQAVGYKSDGTPMYSQAEVSNYVKSKYGCVDYHMQDNGYVALDDPHYTSDGHKINSRR